MNSRISLVPLVGVLAAAGCGRQTLDLGNLSCTTSTDCVADYTCDEASGICITTGDGCGEDGATSPCVAGETTCDQGCRTCTNGAWTDCGSPAQDCVDADGDGLGNGTGGNSGCVDATTDSDDADPAVCADTDLDGCDDCSVSTWDPANDGADTDADGICDRTDDCTDADGDGVGNGNLGNIGCTATTQSDLNDDVVTVCLDTDLDTCDDCVSGSYDPNRDGPDSDNDTICDAADLCDGFDDTLCGTTTCDGLRWVDIVCVQGDCTGTNTRADCDDGVACTTDSCDPTEGCDSTPTPAGGSCGTCRSCDATGNCIDDLANDADCPACEVCAVGGTCTAAAAGTDPKNECTTDACNTGDCNGASACEPTAIGTDCGTCQACDGSGACVDDLSQDADCGTCQECATGGTCANQTAGNDVKTECPDTTFCNGVETCDGSGGCQPGTNPCTAPTICDEPSSSCVGCTTDAHCPSCQRCAGNNCVNVDAGQDPKNNCAADLCYTGNCDGSGGCGFEIAGTDCGTCQACDGSGACIDDMTQDNDCGSCQECGSGGACVDAAPGADPKNECTAGLCATGDCNGSGACELLPAATDCGTCASCDATGDCVDDLTQDGDCGLCQECGAGGTCASAGGGTDPKNECAAGSCTTGDCDGSGACGNVGAGIDCGLCAACDGSGTCTADLTQDDECGFCQECGSIGTCVNQDAGYDVKDNCTAGSCASGDCNGAGACELFLAGTDCGICGACDADGACTPDLTQDADCPDCQECTGVGTCANAGPGTDPDNDCTAGPCASGDCDGAGACELFTAGTDCDVCGACDANGSCIDDLTQDLDCPSCQECAGAGACVLAGAGTDPRNECTQDDCNTGDCDGAGACGFEPIDLPCAGVNADYCDSSCDGAGACRDGTAPICDDGIVCNGVDTCDTASGCQGGAGAPDGTACDEGLGADGNACNSSCQGGVCIAGSNALPGESCTDLYSCTDNDTCDGIGSCAGTENDASCATAGDLCRPRCFGGASGCGTPPAGMTVACVPDPVDLTTTDTSTCTLGLGLTGQDACLSCGAEVGHTIVDFANFDDGAGGCSFSGWVPTVGDLCFTSAAACGLGGVATCCSTLASMCDTTTFGDPVLYMDDGDCGGGIEQLILNKELDMTGMADLEICLDVAESGATDDEGVQVWVADSLNMWQQIYCLNGEVQAGIDNVFYRSCAPLPPWAAGSPDLLVAILVHSNTNNDTVYLDNVVVQGWPSACPANRVTAFFEDFAGCPNPIADGWNDWTVASGSPASWPLCAGTTCASLGAAHNGAEVDSSWMRLERTVDASALDGHIELCVNYGDDGAGAGTNVTMELNTGTGWQIARSQDDDLGPNADCREVCVVLSDIDSAANRNPSLGIAVDVTAAGGPVDVYEITIRGAQYCDAVGNGSMALGPITETGAGSYSIAAQDAAGTRMTSDIMCSWDTPPEGQEVEGSDTVGYLP